MPFKPMPRVKPLLPPDWDADIHEAASSFPASRDFVLNNWDTGDARGMNGLGAILNHPALAKAFLSFNNHVAMANTLSKRICELLILRVSWLRQSEYEFQQHVILGLRAGLTVAEIERVPDGPNAPGWDDMDANLLRAVDELIADACITSATWNRLSSHFSIEQLMDLIFAVGCYEVLAMAFKSLEVPFEDSLPALPEELKAKMYGSSIDEHFHIEPTPQ